MLLPDAFVSFFKSQRMPSYFSLLFSLNLSQCRAIAAVLFSETQDAEGKINFVPLSTSDRFLRLADGTVDISVMATTLTMERELLEVRKR